MSKLLTKPSFIPNFNESNPTSMEINDIDNKLKTQLYRDIEQRKRLLEKRAFAHAQTMFMVDDLVLEPPDYGLGVIPKLTAVDNTNYEAHRIIEECNIGIIKLSIIQRLLNTQNTYLVLGLLNDNQYHVLPLEKIKEIFGATEVTVEEILCS